MQKSFEVEHRLGYRILRWILAVALASGVVVSAIQVILDAQRVSRGLDSDAKQTIAMVKDAATQAVFSIDAELAQQVVDGLFAKVRAALASNRDAVCLLSLEKRYNFELETLSVQAHGYRAFCRHIGRDPSRIQEELANDVEDEERRVVPMQAPSETPLLPQLRGRLVPLDSYPQYFQSYERVPQLELWEIRAV